MNIFKGIVQKGSGYARTLGFPTINIPLEDGSLSGIYAARVTLAQQEGSVLVGKDEAPYGAAVYADQKRKVFEAHLLDFPPKDGSPRGYDDIVGSSVTIELIEKLRESKRFDDEVALRMAIAQDVENVRAFLLKANSQQL